MDEKDRLTAPPRTRTIWFRPGCWRSTKSEHSGTSTEYPSPVHQTLILFQSTPTRQIECIMHAPLKAYISKLCQPTRPFRPSISVPHYKGPGALNKRIWKVIKTTCIALETWPAWFPVVAWTFPSQAFQQQAAQTLLFHPLFWFIARKDINRSLNTAVQQKHDVPRPLQLNHCLCPMQYRSCTWSRHPKLTDHLHFYASLQIALNEDLSHSCEQNLLPDAWDQAKDAELLTELEAVAPTPTSEAGVNIKKEKRRKTRRLRWRSTMVNETRKDITTSQDWKNIYMSSCLGPTATCIHSRANTGIGKTRRYLAALKTQ